MIKINKINKIKFNNIKFSTFSTYSILNKAWTSESIRTEFINYFKNLNYTPVPSASLIPPQNDKSLLFINAGMVPLKQHFINPASAPYPNMVSVQRCVRAGGKDNDLEQVGFTKRHLTMFEMLGSFSFGQVDPATKLNQVWKFLTENLELDKERLRISVLEGDGDTYQIWKSIGIPTNQIVYGPPKDNFWSMGDTEGTPCGPCTEIYYDTRVGDEHDEDRWLEIWNVVFMKYKRGPNNTLIPLETSCIDTGMGLERLTSVLQDKDNAFDIDTMSKLINKINQILPTTASSFSSSQIQSYQRMVADHLRTCAFLIADGVLPSNVGRGYLLRRILRRATRVLKQLGSEKPLLSSLIPTLLETFEESSYPHIHERSASITHIIQQEEQLFSRTLAKGLNLLNDYFASNPNTTINCDLAFLLYDTHGFPLDLVEAIAKEQGVGVDIDGFNKLIEKSKSISKASWKGAASAKIQGPQFHELQQQQFDQTFIGYSKKENLLNVESKIIAIDSSNIEIDNSIWAVLEPNPFYGYGGGQIPDKGIIELPEGFVIEITDVQEAFQKVLAVKLNNLPKNYSLEVNDIVRCSVDVDHRKGLEVHHTATHLLNAALKEFVSKNTVQAGSLVLPNRLRFDFSHPKPLTNEEIKQVENWVNQLIEKDLKTSVKNQNYSEAIKEGAVATFTEKYPEIVRVVDIDGVSKELCGGTHSQSLSQIYPFVITKESGIAANVRRIEAISGSSASNYLFSYRDQVSAIAKSLKAEPDQIHDKIGKLQKENQDSAKLIEDLYRQLSSKPIKSTPLSINIDNSAVDFELYSEDDGLNNSYLKSRYIFIKNELESQDSTEKLHLLISYPNITLFKPVNCKNSLHCGKILKQLLSSKKVGNGGGSSDFAQGRLNRPLLFDE